MDMPKSSRMESLRRIIDVAQVMQSSLPPQTSPHPPVTVSTFVDHQFQLHFPPAEDITSRLVSISAPQDIAEELNNLFLRAVSDLQSTYQQHFTNTCRSLTPHQASGLPTLALVIDRLRNSLMQTYRTHLDRLATNVISSLPARLTASAQSNQERKPRPKFNKDWLPIFEYIFSRCKFPTREDKVRLSEMTGMSYRQIGVWFQNRRSREGKDDNSETTSVHYVGLASPKSEPFADPVLVTGPLAANRPPRTSKRSLIPYSTTDTPTLVKDESTESSSELEEESEHGEEYGATQATSANPKVISLCDSFTSAISSSATFPAPYEAPGKPTTPESLSFNDNSLWPRQTVVTTQHPSQIPPVATQEEVLDLFGGMQLKASKKKQTQASGQDLQKVDEKLKAKEARRQEKEERRREKAERRQKRQEKRERKAATVAGEASVGVVSEVVEVSKTPRTRKHAALPSRATPKPETAPTTTSADDSATSPVINATTHPCTPISRDSISASPTVEHARSFSNSSINTAPSLLPSRSASMSSTDDRSPFEFGRYPLSPADSGSGELDSFPKSKALFDQTPTIASNSNNLGSLVAFDPHMSFSFSPEFTSQTPILAIPPAKTVSMPSFTSVLSADPSNVSSSGEQPMRYPYTEIFRSPDTQLDMEPVSRSLEPTPTTNPLVVSPVDSSPLPLPDPISFELLDLFGAPARSAATPSLVSTTHPTLPETWTTTVDQWTHPSHLPVHSTDLDLVVMLGAPLLDPTT